MKAKKEDSDDKMMQFKSKKKANKLDSCEKMVQFKETLKALTLFIMDQTNNLKYSPTHKDTSTPP